MSGLNDEEVAAEMRKMTAFIKQEALEKAREIKVKADEDFQIEKARIVRQESANIDAELESKKKRVQIERRVAQSKATNTTRLTLLQVREELLENVFEEARQKLGGLTSDKKKYEAVLANLVLEGLYTIREGRVHVDVREGDKDVAAAAIPVAKKKYEEATQSSVEISLGTDLKDSLAGGVLLANGTGKIQLNNTLDERLRLLETTSLPTIRESLFGKNENRKFYT